MTEVPGPNQIERSNAIITFKGRSSLLLHRALRGPKSFLGSSRDATAEFIPQRNLHGWRKYQLDNPLGNRSRFEAPKRHSARQKSGKIRIVFDDVTQLRNRCQGRGRNGVDYRIPRSVLQNAPK